MKGREQKTLHGDGCLQVSRLETEGLVGVQTFMDMTESGLVEAKIDAYHLMEVILSPNNLNDAYKRVKANGGSGGVDGMRMEELLPYLKAHGQELRKSILEGNTSHRLCDGLRFPKTTGRRANWAYLPWLTAYSSRQ